MCVIKCGVEHAAYILIGCFDTDTPQQVVPFLLSISQGFVEDCTSEGMLHIVVAHRYQLYHDESREGCNEEHIELKL